VTSRRDLYATARRAFARGESAQWEAAEAMAELVEMGDTQREIAEQVGCSVATVHRYLAVIRVSRGNRKKSFAEVYTEVRGPHAPEVPRAPEARAKLAADLLKDKHVADAPEVRKVQERNAERRARAFATSERKADGTPSRNEKERAFRRRSEWTNEQFWWNYLSELKRMAKMVGEANGEYDRTGMPNKHAGDIIKAQRALLRALERVDEKAQTTGVGKAL